MTVGLLLFCRLKNRKKSVNWIIRVVMSILDVANSPAIPSNVSVEAPLLADQIVQVLGLGAHRDTVDGVVGAHNTRRMTTLNRGFEGWGVYDFLRFFILGTFKELTE